MIAESITLEHTFTLKLPKNNDCDHDHPPLVLHLRMQLTLLTEQFNG